MLFEGLPEPIDLELDLYNHVLYWTDRGDPPRGNTVNRAVIDGKPMNQSPDILLTHLMEGIGIPLDLKGERMFVTASVIPSVAAISYTISGFNSSPFSFELFIVLVSDFFISVRPELL